MIEVSDGDDDIIILPSKKKTAPPSASQAIPTPAAAATLSSTLPINTFPLTRLDKGKGRATFESTSTVPSVQDSDKTNKAMNFTSNIAIPLTSNTAIPLTLQADLTKPHRLSDEDADSEMAARSDRSSADSDLVDLSTKFNNKNAVKRTIPNNKDANAISALAPVTSRTRKISDENIKPVTSTSTKYDTSTAYGRFKALQETSNASKKATKLEDVTMVPATFNANNTSNMTTMRDVKPPVPSSSSPGNRTGMDSGYLSSINTSSSSPLRVEGQVRI